MSVILMILSLLAIFVVAAIIVDDKKSRRIMKEGKLLRSEIVCRDGEKLYVEKVSFKDSLAQPLIA